MGYRICLGNETNKDVFTEPKGWDRCPCDVPKCPKRPKCEVESIMCRAFDIWASNGSRLLPTGTHMTPYQGSTYYSNEAFKAKQDGKKKKKEIERRLMLKLEALWLDGIHLDEISAQVGMKARNIEMAICRARKGGIYTFPKRKAGRPKNDKRRPRNEVPKGDAPDNRGEFKRVFAEEDRLVQEAQVHETTGDRLQVER